MFVLDDVIYFYFYCMSPLDLHPLCLEFDDEPEHVAMGASVATLAVPWTRVGACGICYQLPAGYCMVTNSKYDAPFVL